MYKLTNTKIRLGSVDRLTRSLRTHDGILRTANAVIDKLYHAFPKSTDHIVADVGLSVGPIPGFCVGVDFPTLKRFCLTYPKVQLLTWDSYVSAVSERLDEPTISVEGFRQSKGREFSEVAIVDFFCSDCAGQDAEEIPAALQKSWKKLLSAEDGLSEWPAELEVQLKVLYTAITRSCSRLLFIETQSSVAGLAWINFLKTNRLGCQYDIVSSMSTESYVTVAESTLGPSAAQVSSGAKEEGELIQFSTVKLPDDWRCDGLSKAAQTDDSENLPSRIELLTQAQFCFSKANDSTLEKKAEEHVKGLRLKQQLQLLLLPKESAESDPALSATGIEAEEKAATCVLHLLRAGMVEEARDICAAWCKRHRLVKLHTRIARVKK